MNDPIVGIDLGTSNSVVAQADGAGVVKVLSDDGGYKIHPSVVSFHPSGGVVVGASAKQRKVIDPHNTIYSFKRLIGRSYRSPEVQTAKTRVPYQIKEGANQMPMIATRGGEFAVPEISAIMLDYVRNLAATRLGTAVQRAVVTVPASFNDAQRSATATAGAIAGITVVRVLNEPTAAALAYGHSRNLRDIIAVYDFGGGTFDISILKLEDQVYEVLGTSGDTFLGGDDLDERLVDKMVAKFLAEHRIDLRTNEVSMMRLRAVAEQTKIELSRRSRAVVRVDEIAYGPKGVPLNLQIEITRDEFVAEVADIIDRTFPVCREALSVAGLSIDRINDIILVGGTTKIPYVRDQVAKFFAKAPRSDVNPEDAVAIGASLQATSLERILARPRRTSQSVKAPKATDEDTTNHGAMDTTSRKDAEDTTSRRAADEETTNAAPITVDVLELADEPPPSVGDSASETNEIADDPSGATMAPSELSLTAPPPDPRAKRSTAGYADPRTATGELDKPDTSYSVMRGGARDRFEGKSKPGFEELTPPPLSAPIGRMTRTNVPTPPPIPVGPPPKTMFGVPSGPQGPDPRKDDSVPGAPPAAKMPAARGQAPITRPPGAASGPRSVTTENIPALNPSTTAPGMGTESTTLPRLPTASPDEWSLNDQQTRPAPATWDVHSHQTKPADPPPGWGDRKHEPARPSPPSWDTGQQTRPAAPPSPATTQPLAPTAPIAPATAPTLVAMGHPPPLPRAATPSSAASTAKGLGPEVNRFDSGFESEEFEREEPVALAPHVARPSPPVLPARPAAPRVAQAVPPIGPNQPTIVPAGPQTRGAPGMQPFQLPPLGPGQPTVVPQAPVQARGTPSVQPLPPPVAPAPPPRPPVVLEVTPRSLGIGTVAGYCEELIRRNSRLPAEMKKLFTTSRDAQDMVRIVVCQGESRRIDHNVVIGDLVLQNLPPRPRGETSIEVTFSVDANGILQVRARDSHTGAEQRASLDLVGGMQQQEVTASRDRIQQLRR